MNRSKSESELDAVGSQELLKSPLKPRYADRFVPSRAGNSWHMTYPETPSSKQVGLFFKQILSIKYLNYDLVL